MGTLFALLIGMLLVGAGVALGIVAHDRSLERRTVVVQCPAEE